MLIFFPKFLRYNYNYVIIRASYIIDINGKEFPLIYYVFQMFISYPHAQVMSVASLNMAYSFLRIDKLRAPFIYLFIYFYHN